MYFDAVLDEKYNPIYNNSPAEIKRWLKENKGDPELETAVVCLGRTLKYISIDDYLARP